MDTTDTKILELMQNNARISMKELGIAVSLTAPAAKERVVRMEEKGIVMGYQTQISLPALGRNVAAYILFETHNCKAFQTFCVAYPDALECHRLAGQYSYLVKINTATMETLEQFIDEAIRYGQSSTHLVFSSVENNVI